MCFHEPAKIYTLFLLIGQNLQNNSMQQVEFKTIILNWWTTTLEDDDNDRS